jgi:hypothetical protein
MFVLFRRNQVSYIEQLFTCTDIDSSDMVMKMPAAGDRQISSSFIILCMVKEPSSTDCLFNVVNWTLNRTGPKGSEAEQY